MNGLLRVAVDAQGLLGDRRGMGRYLAALLRRFVARTDIALTLLVTERFPALVRPRLERFLGGSVARVTRTIPADIDVVWNPWNGMRTLSPAPAVVTLHDAVPLAFPSGDARRRAHGQEAYLRGAQRSRVVLANSAFTASEAERRADVSPDRIRVTPLGVEGVFAADGPRFVSMHRPYVLFVGTFEPRKNFATLVTAFQRAFPHGEHILICAGAIPHGYPNVFGFNDRDPDDMGALYRSALLTAVPSTYEGFGLPVLESMACGTPVVRSAGSALDETGGDATVRIDDPRSVEAWSEALLRVAYDAPLREELRERGLARAREFSWDRCAEQTFDALREAAAG